jgi:hypothetical protein
VARPERFELPTSWFVARRSIQLSYGRKGREYYHNDCRSPLPGGRAPRSASRMATETFLSRAQAYVAEREGFEPSKGF